jgi:radical SAM C-methyltransferase
MLARKKRQICLVQRGVWDMDRESMPLAVGYLKSIADADPAIRAEADIRICNFGGGDGVLHIARSLFFGQSPPDAIGFSVLGWNFHEFGKIAQLYRSLKPEGWIIFGGNHVSDQAARVFGMYPDVDVIVNGEGELTFLDLTRVIVAGGSRHALHDVAGISFRTEDGAIVTTPSRPRIDDLDVIPSPMLSGTLPLLDDQGKFRYDVVLMETNRGCPYKCAFCYWGGATGQKLRQFSPERIAAEIEFCAYHQVPDIVLCDSNFGMLRSDAEFVEILVRARERYGYPRGFETSWAKNKGKIFYSIVQRMKETGFRSSFTLALQTLAPPALELMGRKNMKLNEWQELAHWLAEHRLDCYAELIWGVPGETTESFLEGYDQLASYVSRIAVYPHLVMPNTDFSRDRQEHGFVLLRGDKDDFEYVLAHRSMSIEDNQRMHRFLFWARVVAENQVLRWIWTPLRQLCGIPQSQVLFSLDQWFERQTDPVSQGLIACRAEMVDNLDASRVTRGIHYFYREGGIDNRLFAWWREEIMPRVPEELKDFFTEILRYDLLTRPILIGGSSRAKARQQRGKKMELAEHRGSSYFVRRDVRVKYDVPSLVKQIAAGEQVNLTPTPIEVDLYYKDGFATHIDNHEFVTRYVGKPMADLEEEVRVFEECRALARSSIPDLEGVLSGLVPLRPAKQAGNG